MTLLFFLVFFPLLTVLLGGKAAIRQDRAFLITVVASAWLIVGLLLIVVNQWLPFTGGGDDETYFELAATPINRLSDIFDLTRFTGIIEQPGFPWLLSLLNAVAGQELLIFKWLNLFFYILLLLTWYRIGLAIQSERLARLFVVAILLLSPLWYYTFFLLKDMVIVLLQSVFMLVAVRMWNRVTAGALLRLALCLFGLLLLRTPLLMQDAAVLLAVLALRNIGKDTRATGLATLIGAVVVVGLLAQVLTDPAIMMNFGIYTEQRLLGSAAMIESVELLQESGSTSALGLALFPVRYVLNETAGFNPDTWSRLDELWLRGVLAIPWVVFGAPFLVLGLRSLLRAPEGFVRKAGLFARLTQARALASPWGALLLFVFSSFVISWWVRDSTRWRLADMPAVAAIAVAGWSNTRPSRRPVVLLAWSLAIVGSYGLYYLWRS